MSKEIKIAGSISFGGKRLNVYGDLDAPPVLIIENS